MNSAPSLEGLNELSAYAFAALSRLDPQLLELTTRTPPAADCPTDNLPGRAAGKARQWLNLMQQGCLIIELAKPRIYKLALLGRMTVVRTDGELRHWYFLRPNV